VTLSLEEGADHPAQLVVTVADTGMGLPEEVTAGIGLHSMRERAAELGGVCTVGSGEAGGTVVWARLPVAFPEL
jgi:signal transduction histidine kinase